MKENRRIELSRLPQNLPPVNLQQKDGTMTEEQEHLDKLKYLRLKKAKGPEAISLKDVIALPVNDR
jgi:hypothetical protein